MRIVGKFEKVSKEQFVKDWRKTFKMETEDEELQKTWDEYLGSLYDEIKLPKRATTGSAGYDLFAPLTISLHKGESMVIPTGIRVRLNEGWMLKLFPRSGLGFKFRLQIDNTVGIIDQDYYFSDNEGHIFVKITNDSKIDTFCHIEKGKGFAQAIFEEFGITEDDDTTGIRNGGFGSTTKEG